MFVFRLLAFKFICLLIFISRLLLNFMYFRFELFLYDLIFLAGYVCVECVVTGMLFTMQTKEKIQSCNMEGYLKMFIFSYNIMY